MDYYHFEAEDLAADDYFKGWVCAPDLASDLFWKTFLSEYPERYYQIEEARLLVLGLTKLEQDGGEGEQVNRIWTKIEGSLGTSSFKRFVNERKISWILAASVLLLSGIGWVLKSQGWFHADAMHVAGIFANEKWVTAVTDKMEVRTVVLPDGSRVELKPGSSLRYPQNYGTHQRTVYLKGEGFFEVRKNPEMPFRVYANGLVTRVLGTSFNVQARDHDPNVTVAVRSGRVSVYSDQGRDKDTKDPETKGLVLTANQQAIYRRASATLNKTLVADPVVQIPKENQTKFVFEDASAAVVFDALEVLYGIEVSYDGESLKDCRLTIHLDDENLFQKLEVICKVLEVDYKLIDAQVIIYGSGCR